MGRAQYKLRRDVMAEKGKIEKAGAKRGLWSKIGMALGGLIVMGLTGGAAAPAVAALAAGAGTAAGGFAGRQLAAKSKGGKIRGGKFFQDERESLIGQIDESIWAGALKSGLSAGALSFMGGAMPKLGYSTKGGLSITAGGGKAAAAGTEAAATAGGKGIPGMFSKAFKGGESAHTYSDSLLGKVGKALDVKGSAIGSKVGTMMHEGGWTGKELTGLAEEGLATGRGVAGRRGYMAPGEITSRVEGAETAARIKEGGFLQFDDPGQYARKELTKQSQPVIDDWIMNDPQFTDPGMSQYRENAPRISQVNQDKDKVLETAFNKQRQARLDQEQGLFQIQEETKQKALDEIGALKQQEVSLATSELSAEKTAGTGYGAFDRWIRGYGDTSDTQNLFNTFDTTLQGKIDPSDIANTALMKQHEASSRYYMPGNISPKYNSAASLLMRRNK